jgi:hypothetical protein
MRIRHLNCGSMRKIDPPGTAGRPQEPARALNHCLLAETDAAGLVLVETGSAPWTSNALRNHSAGHS